MDTMSTARFSVFAINFITILGDILTYAIFARVILSWLTMGQTRDPGRIASFINDITDPFLNLAKKLPHKIGMIDLSPLIALFGLNFLVYFLVRLIAGL